MHDDIAVTVLFVSIVFEVDEFFGDNEGLVMAEVEFPTAAEAMAFQPPAWFGEEVTYDPAYSNSNLSKQKFDG